MGWMEKSINVVEKIDQRLGEIEKDERLLQPSATIDINAPLALIQLALETERDTLKRVKSWMEGKEQSAVDILGKVVELISKQLDLKDKDINLESKLKEDLGVMESWKLGHSSNEIVVALEDTFSVVIPDKEAEKLLTVRDIVEYLKSQGVGQKGNIIKRYFARRRAGHKGK